ncbi:MAG: hypothetical protein ABIO94_13100 [Opitutaceae bacterium]
MMITSTSSSDRTTRPGQSPKATRAISRTAPTDRDQLSTKNAALLDAALLRHPEIRPEVVARARALLADPEYPSKGIVRVIAHHILSAPDVSEDHS